ncbi:anthranilate synthase component I [Hydrogenobacter hydrogenophilus]|uniref:Anthranilate synthase component 1 n=1 Tax=Hydrogenobacter hydrogenophilus TaxID=35835 RepID=A0A285P2M7_9AQUI|nr:anthranilate synthase component I [Hydrogenobacter hydrogenophilus]SNZ15999.1 anthranilate synthase, component I [Hydrogenobacter hydrogenophilus]
MLSLNLNQVKELSKNYSVIPLFAEVLADTETPLSLFLKLKKEGHYNILLESAEGGSKWGRYSFVIRSSSFIFKYKKGYGEVFKRGKVWCFESKDPLEVLKSLMRDLVPYKDERLPRFWGGFVGYIGYDVVKCYEPVKDEKPDPIGTYDIFMVLTDLVVIHDNLTGKIKILSPIFVDVDVEESYKRAKVSIETAIEDIFTKSIFPVNYEEKEPHLSEWHANMRKEEFESLVIKAKEYIARGDIIQVVPSLRFSKNFKGRPEDLYRILRFLNPSPYMYYLELGHVKVIGSSPEVLVRLEDGKVETRPIAGTRRRGLTEEEDKALEEELLRDEKERAEHLMLVDLARNDIGKVSKQGSVRVKEFMTIERYSHVMHIVSHVVGDIQEGLSAVDVIKATFPAGTVSGAPKVRAMQIIEELEPERRGIYAGCVGYISFQGNTDMAIAIRTAVIRGDEVFLQAGAGIVADSDPEKEWWEIVSKAKALMKAVSMAETQRT